ncbi:hypothetical protein QFC20_006447 [Naganishia adeliensis]|uniref:Uncharacterized protein n=1 Tax=Naganishia adeliensis TaxID=92952 RepID=A0ACC2VAC9_9TREE|nr:hypothetical protein QFC20_006447 [Naganishia adeliensis]
MSSEKAEQGLEVAIDDKKQDEQDVAIPTLDRVETAGADTTLFPVISTYKAVILVALVTASSMMQVASGIGVSITIADIGHDLKIPSGQLQWVASAGSLGTACTLLVCGKLADMYGHKPVFVIGCTLGGAMFLGMGLARDKYSLFVFRALGGVAFSGVTPAAIGLIGTTFPEGPAKSRAFAGLGAGAPVGTAIGLVLAGLTTQYTPAGWRTFFWICSGLSVALAIGAVFVAPGSLIPRARSEHTLKGLDWIGVILSAIAIFCIVFPLGEGGNAPQGWKTPFVWIILGVGIVLSVLFVLWEMRLEKRGTKQPLMKMSIWNRKIIIVWMTLYWRSYEGRTVVQITLRFLPLCVCGVLANIVGSFAVAHLTGHVLLMIAGVATALAALFFAVTPSGLTYWALQFPACCVLVLGADFMFLTSMLFISRTSSQSEQGQGGSIFSAIVAIGSALMLAISTIVSDRVAQQKAASLGVIIEASKTQSSDIPKPALLQGYRAAFWTCFGLSMLAVVVVAVFLRKMGTVGRKKKADPAEQEDKADPVEHREKTEEVDVV